MLQIKRENIKHEEVTIEKVLKKITLPKFQRIKNESHVEKIFQNLPKNCRILRKGVIFYEVKITDSC